MRKYKIEKITKTVALGVGLMLPSVNFAALDYADPTTHAHLLKILNANQEQLSRLDDVNSEISRASNMLGSVSDDNVITRHGI